MPYFQVLLVRYRRRKSSVPEFRYPVPQGESTGTWWVGLGKKEGVAEVAAFGFRRPKENTGGVQWVQGTFIVHHSEFGPLERREEEFTLLDVILM